MYLCASSMPPSKDIGGYLSEYVHNVAYGASTDSEVQILALNTLNALKRSVKAGPRHTIPGRGRLVLTIEHPAMTIRWTTSDSSRLHHPQARCSPLQCCICTFRLRA